MPTFKGFTPGTYVVRNTGRRARVRDEVAFPRAGDDGPSETTVEIDSAEQYLRIKATRGLELELGELELGEVDVADEEPDSSSFSPYGAVGLDTLSRRELVEQAAARGLSTEGTKAQLLARLRGEEAPPDEEG